MIKKLWSDFWQEQRFPRPPIQWEIENPLEGGGHETQNLFPSSEEVKNEQSYTSTTQYAFMVYVSTILPLLYNNTLFAVFFRSPYDLP
jgi:hypothetical protein